jgi:beta-glucosidase
MYRALMRAARLGKPIYITETGLPDADDDQRPRFLVTHLAQVARAIADGADVRGFYHWTLVDNFEWAEGWALRFGLIGLDEMTGERRLRDSGRLFSAIAERNGITRDMVETYAPELVDAVLGS